jgi:hypothetical protein
MAGLKTFPRGSVIFKEGDKIACLYLIDTGSVSLGFHRGKNFIEIYTAAKSNILGESALFGGSNHRNTAIASSEVKMVEVPLESVATLLEQQPQVFKVVIRAIGDRLKLSMAEMRTLKLEKDSTPCPPASTPKAFGAVFHTAQHTGRREKNRVSVDWRALKAYCSRIFFEEAKRVESVVNILVKLKLATLEFGKNEEDPKAVEELMQIHFLDLVGLEQFFEFYQHYLNKSGKQELLRVEDSNYFLVEAMLQLCQGQEPDRVGSIRVDFNQLAEFLKMECSMNLNKDHFGTLELKGLFVKRAVAPDGSSYVAFNYQEFASTFQNWKFLLEIDRWNENGFVDLKTPALVRKKFVPSTGVSCPECKQDVEAAQKFCGHCGTKLATAA